MRMMQESTTYSRKEPVMKTVRQFLTLTCQGIIVATTLVFCGCGNSEKSGASAKSTHEMETVRVGAVLPLTGPAAQLGQDEKAGIDLALRAYAPTRRQVRFVIEDSQLKPSVAVTAIKKMLDIDGIRIFIATTTGIVLGITPALTEFNGDKLLFTAHTVPQGTKGIPFMYRLYPAADQEMQVVADYAVRKGFRRVGAFCLANQAGEQSVALFREHMQKADIEVVLTETFAPTQADFRQTLLKFKAANVQAILITGYTSHYKPIFRQIIEAGMGVTVLGGVATPLGDMEKDLPLSFLSKVVFPGCRFYFAPTDSVVADFKRRVEQAGMVPNYEMAYAFDYATTLMKAMDAAASETPRAIADAIAEVTPFDGVTGTITFDNDRDIIADLRPCTWGELGIRLAE